MRDLCKLVEHGKPAHEQVCFIAHAADKDVCSAGKVHASKMAWDRGVMDAQLLPVDIVLMGKQLQGLACVRG
mgnify:CR=1 FL=1